MARVADSLFGHGAHLERLLSGFERDHLPHALLFSGPSGIGKKKVALALAQALTCEASPRACGQCGSCRRAEALHSEKMRLVAPEGASIKVDQVRDILHFLSLSHVGENRVIIFDDAHLMNPQAANSLLKSLEEPYPGVYYILLGPETNLFLPTIRSRCQVFRFSPLQESDLRALRPGLAPWIYSAARGQIETLETLSSVEGVALREQGFQLLEQFVDGENFLLNEEWRRILKDREMALRVIQKWLFVLRDLNVLRTHPQTDLLLNSDRRELLLKMVNKVGSRLTDLSRSLMRAEREMKFNLDPILVIESMWVSYARGA
jgi:DNA polymerase III subunit delta'